MLLTPTHRRSARLTKEAYQKANRVESTPGKWKRAETQAAIKDDIEDDIYDECPELKGYEYDKDHYLANDRYAKIVDDEINTLKEQNELDEAIKSHDEDLKNAAKKEAVLKDAAKREEDINRSYRRAQWINRKVRYFDRNGNQIS